MYNEICKDTILTANLMAKTDIIRQFYGKNEKTCRNLSFGRILFVYLHRIVSHSCAIGKKDGTRHLIAQFPDELPLRLGI